MFCLFSLGSLLLIPGISCQNWMIQYRLPVKCAIKGSTVFLSGSYKHPDNLTVTKIFWTVNMGKSSKNIDLLDHPDYKGRVQYYPQEARELVLKLSNVTHKDAQMYCLRVETNEEDQKYLGYPGIELKVTELRVEIPEEVIEKQSVALVCKSSCNLSNTNFIWYKNGKPLSELMRTNQLLLSSVSSEDSGKYSCDLRGKKHLQSPAITLNVRYPPRSVSVSVSGSAEIVEGDSVTLSCSSDSNPPAEIHWFKGSSFVRSGLSFSITNITSEASGDYYCSARNKHGSQSSSAVNVDVMYPPRSVSVSVSGSAEIVEGDSVTLSCSSDSNPPALTFSWFQESQTSAVGSGQTFIISSFNSSHSGRFYCEAQNKHGSQRSASVSLTVKESSSWISVTVGVSVSVVLTSVILMVFFRLFRRHNKTVESPEDAYMTLDLKTRCPEYDTLDNVKRSCENKDNPEDQDYYNIDK